jgi:hypothetical protein
MVIVLEKTKVDYTIVFTREIKQNRKTSKGLTQIRLEENEAENNG